MDFLKLLGVRDTNVMIDRSLNSQNIVMSNKRNDLKEKRPISLSISYSYLIGFTTGLCCGLFHL